MNIKEKTVTTYETDDGQVFDSLAEARVHLLEIHNQEMLKDGVRVDKFIIYLLNIPEDFSMFVQAKSSEGVDNRFLFDVQNLQFPMFICEKKVIEDGDYFAVHYEYDYLENVIRQQEMVVENLKYILENPPGKEEE